MKTTLDSETAFNAKAQRREDASRGTRNSFRFSTRGYRGPRPVPGRSAPPTQNASENSTRFPHTGVLRAGTARAPTTDWPRPSAPWRLGGLALNALRAAALAALLAAGGWPCAGQTTLQINKVGHWPAHMPVYQLNSVTVRSNLAYVGTYSSGMFVLDVSNPSRCTSVGHCKVTGGNLVWDVALHGNYAYLAGGAAMDIFDVRDPSQPVRVNSYGVGASRVKVQGNYAYVVDSSGTLTIFYVADPANPVWRGATPSLGISSITGLAVSGNYAYLAHSTLGLKIINVANPSNPVLVGSYKPAGMYNARGVAVSGSYVYFGYSKVWNAGAVGFDVINVSNPANPVPVGGLGFEAGYLAVAGNYVYDTGGRVIDVSDPTNPVLRGSAGGSGYGIAVAGSYVFVAGSPGVRVFDVSDPTNPAPVSVFDSREPKIAAARNPHVFMTGGNGFQVLDVSNSARPREVGWCEALFWQDDYNVSLFCGNYLYASGLDGLLVMDVSDPTAPSCVSTNPNGGRASGIAAVGNYLCLAKGGDGLLVFDISNPTNPVYRGSYDSPGNAYAVSVVSNYAFVADGDAGLQVVNLSNPSNPVRVAGYDTPGRAGGVAVSGNHVYVADGYVGGLQVLRFTPPSSCVRVGRLMLWDARDVVVVGPYAYVTVGDDGVEVIDVSDPTKPVSIGRCANGSSSGRLLVDGNSVYVQRDGVDILRTDAHPRLLTETLLRLPDGRPQFRLSGALGQTLEIQSSSDLVQWSVAGGLTNTSGQEWFTDPVAEPSPRFYRARVVR